MRIPDYRHMALAAAGLLLASQSLWAQSPVQTRVFTRGSEQTFVLENAKIVQEVRFRDGHLQADALKGRPDWLSRYHTRRVGVYTDGDFGLKMMWTAWSAPGRDVNADVRMNFTKKDFHLDHYRFRDVDGAGRQLDLYLVADDRQNNLRLQLRYRLDTGAFFSRRQLALADSLQQTNWLETFNARSGVVHALRAAGSGQETLFREESGTNLQAAEVYKVAQPENNRIIKEGSFGQPAALQLGEGGAFFGVEYPAATTTCTRLNSKDFQLHTRELIGTVIGKNWVPSKWVVEGLAPNSYVQDWFYNYLPSIQAAPNQPYSLYNSWYDLRSPQYPGVQPNHVMNETNILHIIQLFEKNMIRPYGIHLDAFVLDDGWDTYDGPWRLRASTFPHGLAPIVDSLSKLGTTLGIWLGPTGGYSFRMKRIDWMKAHGYEVSGQGAGSAMLCLGGRNYSRLFRERTTEFAREGVGYFKWDGLQFSCSDPSHGHPVGYFSRKAILDSLIDKVRAVRRVNPHEYLNITSGTWLSPWWLRYANQIWMQGADYGFADVPSASERDASMTYKDFVLYDDFHNKDAWFPLAHLMTHGIIKGNLASVGGKDDPLDRFTDDAVFYFARGVTMYEMYISPDLLDAGEWNALSKSLAWARDRFPLMAKTFMVGGDPTHAQAYGYVHFKGSRGIIAARNPAMEPSRLHVVLDPSEGLNAEANSLVLERVYPTHWISPRLYGAGSQIDLPLDGYEAAVYEVYPLDRSTKPLLAGVTYDRPRWNGSTLRFQALAVEKDLRVLNPQTLKGLKVDGKAASLLQPGLSLEAAPPIASALKLKTGRGNLELRFRPDPSDLNGRILVFLHPDSASRGQAFPGMHWTLDGKAVQPLQQLQQGVWAVYTLVLDCSRLSREQSLRLQLSAAAGSGWKGSVKVWLVSQQRQASRELTLSGTDAMHPTAMPPSPFLPGALKRQQLLGSLQLAP